MNGEVLALSISLSSSFSQSFYLEEVPCCPQTLKTGYHFRSKQTNGKWAEGTLPCLERCRSSLLAMVQLSFFFFFGFQGLLGGG